MMTSSEKELLRDNFRILQEQQIKILNQQSEMNGNVRELQGALNGLSDQVRRNLSDIRELKAHKKTVDESGQFTTEKLVGLEVHHTHRDEAIRDLKEEFRSFREQQAKEEREERIAKDKRASEIRTALYGVMGSLLVAAVVGVAAMLL